MILRVSLWSLLLMVAFWLDVFLLPSAGAVTALSISVVVLSFAARGVPPAAAAVLGGVLGLSSGMAGAAPAGYQAVSGALAGFVTSWLAHAYVSRRSLLSAAAVSFLCAALFWMPAVASGAVDVIRGISVDRFGAALWATAVQASVAACVSLPLLLLGRARDARVRRTPLLWR